MKRYFALLDGEPGAYGVAFPDCPGGAAMGADEDEAYANAVAALGEWMHDAGAVGETPAPRTIDALRRDPDVVAALAEGAVFLAVPLVIEVRARGESQYFARSGPARRDRCGRQTQRLDPLRLPVERRTGENRGFGLTRPSRRTMLTPLWRVETNGEIGVRHCNCVIGRSRVAA